MPLDTLLANTTLFNSTTTRAFADAMSEIIEEQEVEMEVTDRLIQVLSYTVTFLFAYFLGRAVVLLRVPVPEITAYLLSGIIVGNGCLGLIDIRDDFLPYFNKLCLAIICLFTGAELHLDFLQERLKAIGIHTLLSYGAVYLITLPVLWALHTKIAFMRELPTYEIWSVIFLAASILPSAVPSCVKL